MDWRTYYKEHTMKPEDAVSVIKDGDRVVFGHAVGEPIIFQPWRRWQSSFTMSR